MQKLEYAIADKRNEYHTLMLNEPDRARETAHAAWNDQKKKLKSQYDRLRQQYFELRDMMYSIQDSETSYALRL